MNIVIWVLQALVALGFIMAGVMKATGKKEKLAENMAWVKDFSPTQIKLIGGAEILGGLGIILPALTGVLTWLTPLAGAALTLLMLGAIYTHIRRKEVPQILPSAVLGLMACFVAVGRFVILPV